ncbi:rho gtpase-activating protein 11a [Lasius niger]|uniref:Rho gtpase-activating protein 11a n=1 Tax=Lasius niger TaxID=67767 RepID=A0A0J7N567_LASNI|nr:rho gtpase-activating protein 11a [Lasius niger]
MLIYDVLHKEKVYHIIASDLRSFGVKYRFKKSMLKSERPEACKNISKRIFKTALFYQPLDIVNLSSGAIVHVPVFVIQASTFLEKYITQEGLFRKAGSQARQKELISRLDGGGSLGEKNYAIDVANCLKSFFRDLPEPLIPYTYHDLFVHCALLKSYRVQAILLACTLLPPYHLNTLAFFMEFLKKVSMYEKQNKMSIENLAKVVGPNIMPLQDTSMSAVQNRLQMHLTIIKILIENSENIGILPPHIAQSISTETSGSTDNGLDSFEHGNPKKKKHRSGSLTRMFNGLKKMVGKGTDDTPNINHLHSAIHPVLSNMPPNKFTKKRKVAEREYPPSIKKKRMAEKLDKSKKIRLSLDKFVPKNKQKNADGDLSDLYMNNYKSCSERHWNSQEYDDIFIDATVDLSDNDEQNLLINESHCKSDEQWHMNVSRNSRKLNATDESDNICLMPEEKTDLEKFNTLLNTDTVSLSSDHCEEDYVRISKKEYEEIKNRVSAIESRISQEFGCIYNEEHDMTTHSVNKVQTAYEKTLEEASIEDTLTSDYLAKKLSKELKIRRSREHKIIRSPSARKIGSLRRRSQEKLTRYF